METLFKVGRANSGMLNFFCNHSNLQELENIAIIFAIINIEIENGLLRVKNLESSATVTLFNFLWCNKKMKNCGKIRPHNAHAGKKIII